MEQPFWRLESEGRLPNGQHGVTLHWRPLRRGRAAGLEVGSGRGNSEGRRRLVLAFENGPRTSRPCFPAQLSIEVLGIRPQDVRSRIGGHMPTGTIARLLIDKGFGFIRDEGGIEHFFHRSSVRGAVFELLREGQRVEFTTEESAKGPRAGEVRLIEG
jgi:CspA family cold shock protein